MKEQREGKLSNKFGKNQYRLRKLGFLGWRVLAQSHEEYLTNEGRAIRHDIDWFLACEGGTPKFCEKRKILSHFVSYWSQATKYRRPLFLFILPQNCFFSLFFLRQLLPWSAGGGQIKGRKQKDSQRQ